MAQGFFVAEKCTWQSRDLSSILLLPIRKSLHYGSTYLHNLHSVPYTFSIRRQISIALIFSAVKNCTNTSRHCLEESVMRTMHFNVPPRYHSHIWQDVTMHNRFPAFYSRYKSMRSHLNLQKKELLQKCQFLIYITHSKLSCRVFYKNLLLL